MNRRRPSIIPALPVVVVAVGALLALLYQLTNPSTPTDTTTSGPVPAVGNAELEEQIRALPAVTPDQLAAATSYDRDAFGKGWLDLNGNGCDTREEILARDMDGGRLRGCRVTDLVIDDPYTGVRIDTRTDPDGTAAVHIDHIVPLAAAWRSGAAAWPPDRRERFANSGENLLAVDAGANIAKGDSTPDEWMPANRAAWCDYLTRYINVSTDYQVAVTDQTRAALLTNTTTC